MTSLLARAAEVSGRSFAGWRNSEWEKRREQEAVRKRKHSSSKWFNSVINIQNRLTRAASAVINTSLIDEDQRKLTRQSTNNPASIICIKTISHGDSSKLPGTEVNWIGLPQERWVQRLQPASHSLQVASPMPCFQQSLFSFPFSLKIFLLTLKIKVLCL